VHETLRRHLRASVVGSAAPYGYTLTIFGAGSVAEDLIGKPHLLEVLLYVAGAVAGFLLVGAVAFGRLRVSLSKPDTGPEAIWGHAHLLSAGAAICSAWAFLQVLDSDVAWLVVGFLATTVYLLLDAVQTTLAGLSAR
jgi:hypothetical protein